MTLGRFATLFSTRAAALALALGGAGTAAAADLTPPVVAGPSVVEAAPYDCPTCHGAAPAAGCATCGKSHSLFHKPCKPYVTHLCPGACFGYFQTQWHRWENVCPIPYQGVGQTDRRPDGALPQVPGAVVSPGRVPTEPNAAPKGKGSDAPLPAPKPLPNPPGTPAPTGAGTPTPMPLIPSVPR